MRIIVITVIMIILLGISPQSSFAFDRNALVQSTRAVYISNFTYNINTVNISLNSNGNVVGSTDHSLPAYQSIAQITAQIEALKQQLKNFSPK